MISTPPNTDPARLNVAVGHSADIDLEVAIDSVVDQARADLAGMQASCGLLFVAHDLDLDRVLDGLNTAFPGVSIVGCTSAGEA